VSHAERTYRDNEERRNQSPLGGRSVETSFSHSILGIVYYSEARYDEAINQLNKAIALDPKNATAHNYLGITSSQKGWNAVAEKDLAKAIAIDPKYGDAYFNLAVVLATKDPPDKENAERHYRKALELGAEPDKALEDLIK
jgi:Flp pilus assembly protein TadD